MQQLFVSGIGTEVGKTVVSAILVEALQADYWKPVQAGDLYHSDTDKIKAWTNKAGKFHPETYRLNTPASPHYAAKLDNIDIQLTDFHLPKTNNHLIVEGAGGLYVPLNNKDLIIDLIAHLGIPVVLVSRNYLGSINHTLLSIEALTRRNIPIAGLVFNGVPTPSTEQYILSYFDIPLIAHVDEIEEITSQKIQAQSLKFHSFFKKID